MVAALLEDTALMEGELTNLLLMNIHRKDDPHVQVEYGSRNGNGVNFKSDMSVVLDSARPSQEGPSPVGLESRGLELMSARQCLNTEPIRRRTIEISPKLIHLLQQRMVTGLSSTASSMQSNSRSAAGATVSSLMPLMGLPTIQFDSEDAKQDFYQRVGVEIKSIAKRMEPIFSASPASGSVWSFPTTCKQAMQKVGGWEPLVLKLHQVLAFLLLVRADENITEQKQHSKGLSPTSSSYTRLPEVKQQTNEFETMALWHAIKACNVENSPSCASLCSIESQAMARTNGKVSSEKGLISPSASHSFIATASECSRDSKKGNKSKKNRPSIVYEKGRDGGNFCHNMQLRVFVTLVAGAWSGLLSSCSSGGNNSSNINSTITQSSPSVASAPPNSRASDATMSNGINASALSASPSLDRSSPLAPSTTSPSSAGPLPSLSSSSFSPPPPGRVASFHHLSSCDEATTDIRNQKSQMSSSRTERCGLVLVVDVEVLLFACQCHGRYDAYLVALVAFLLQSAMPRELPHEKRDEDMPLDKEQVRLVADKTKHQGFTDDMNTYLHLPEVLCRSNKMVSTRALHALRVYRDSKDKGRVSHGKYEWYLTLLTSGSVEAVHDTLADLETDLWHSQFDKSDDVSLNRLEQLLIALLGHSDPNIVSQAVALLNAFYDKHDWQRQIPFVPSIASVNDRFALEVKIDDEHCSPVTHPNGPEGVFLLLVAPCFDTDVKYEVYTYHHFIWDPSEDQHEQQRSRLPTPSSRNHQDPHRTAPRKYRWRGRIDFGRFTRCGFYDWRVVRANVHDGSWQAVHTTMADLRCSSSANLTSKIVSLGAAGELSSLPAAADLSDTRSTYPLQGRWIVQPSNIQDEQLHEIFVDQHEARWDAESGELTQRGAFASVAASFERLRQSGITTTYLMGALARDNGDILYTNYGDLTYERPDASPFAVTCRATPNSMLGGVGGFLDLMREAKRVGMKVIVDSLSRISSSRPHRKYRQLALHCLDEQSKKIMLYGSDGRAVSYEDSTMLNYRKKAAWDLLTSDVKAWALRLRVDGIRLDNAQAWPQILQADERELSRVDPDGQSHYTPEERLFGDVVIPLRALARNAFFSYCGGMLDGMEGGRRKGGSSGAEWCLTANAAATTHIVKSIWQGDRREFVVSLPTPESTDCLRQWFDCCHSSLPPGAILIQSSCSHSSPLPGLLYGRGAWPAVDLLFFLPDVPSTFAGEMEGMAFRFDVATIYQTCEGERGDDIGSGKSHEDDSSSSSMSSGQAKGVRNQSSSTLDHRRLTGLPNSASAINLPAGGPTDCNLQANSVGVRSTGALLSRVRSLNRFEAVTSLPALEEEHHRQLGPEYGFDLKRIQGHYDHRRILRHRFRMFRSGSLIPLSALQADGTPHPQVLAFSRCDVDAREFALVVINFSESQSFEIMVSLKPMAKHLQLHELPSNSVFECTNLLRYTADGGQDPDPEMLSITELLLEPQVLQLQVLNSVVLRYRIMSDAEAVDQARVMSHLYLSSITRLEVMLRKAKAQAVLHAKPLSGLQRNLHQNFVLSSLMKCLTSTVGNRVTTEPAATIAASFSVATEVDNDARSVTVPQVDEESELQRLDDLANFLQNLHSAMQLRKEKGGRDKAVSADVTPTRGPRSPELTSSTSAPTSLFDFCVDSGLFADSDELSAQLLARLQKISNGAGPRPATGACELAREVLQQNSLGPIVFVTPELGRWSSVGGLGVMVDELATALAQDVGQEVWVMSPYYERNRKGEQGYLARDGITHSFNVEIHVAGEIVTLGIHEGTVKGVRLFFLHNTRFFPTIYPDVGGSDAVRILVVFAKGALEVLCKLRNIPQIIVTNDWPSSLIPAYAKRGFFGDVFNNTTFFHIIHNLDPSYEGRIYPNNKDDMCWVHNLPAEFLVDPHWQQYVINPSRCVLLNCDAWGTVSPSYRDDLQGRGAFSNPSPLAPLLNRYKSPFAYPNGIPIESREARLRSLGFKDHWEAKAALQRKYFSFGEADFSIPLFAFIGRITAQKGVHLILEAAESIIRRYENRVQILVGGMANWKEPYSAQCARRMKDLRSRFPWSFWADPNDFFVDGSLVNLGADFGLMPSAFEPGGIVQHEFFVAGTPVLAYKTGGLKDTVAEFQLEHQRGNGFTFEVHNLGDFLFAMERAIRVFSDEKKYAVLRRNARDSVVSCKQVAKAWLGEFCRLRRKIAVNPDRVAAILETLPDWIEKRLDASEKSQQRNEQNRVRESPRSTPARDKAAYGTVIATTPGPIPTSPPPALQEINKSVKKSMPELTEPMSLARSAGPPRHIASGSNVYTNVGSTAECQENASNDCHRPTLPNVAEPGIKRTGTVTAMQLIACRLKYNPPSGRARPRTVAVAGSFDDWRVRRPLSWDHSLQAFTISLALQPGRYFYKLIVDGDWICNLDELTEKDSAGNINNVLNVT